MRPRRTTDGDARARVLVWVLVAQVVLAAALIGWVLAGSPLP